MDIELRKILDKVYANKMKPDEAQWKITVLLGVINAERTVCHACKEDIADYFVSTLDVLRCPECGNKWHTDL